VASRFQWDDFVLDLDSYRLERAGRPLSLEPKAFNLLALMVKRPGHLFTKQELFEALWADTAVTDHALTRVIAQLRRILGDEAREARYIETVPTRGYRWIQSVTEIAPVEKTHQPPETGEAPKAPETHKAPRFAGAIAALSLGVAALLFLLWAQRSVPASALASDPKAMDPKWPMQLTTHGGLDFHPSLSPQGDAIAFASDRTGAFEIHVRGLANGSADVPLTANGGQNVQPAWSPDGQMLAFHSMRDGGIWTMAARGGTARQISTFGSHPTWSPDGSRLAFQSSSHGDVSPFGSGAHTGSTIWLVDRDGANARALTAPSKPQGGHASPDWSNNGRFIVFSVFDGDRENGTWMVPSEGGDPWALSRGIYQYDPVFSHDDSAVYVAGGHAWILVLPLDSSTGKLAGEQRPFAVPGVQGVRGITVSPDGRRLGFAAVSLDSQIWSLGVSPNGTGEHPSAVTSDTSHRNSGPVYSSDGRRIAYMSIRQGALPNVSVMDADGRNASQLTSDETAEFRPAWSKDRRRIAFLSRRDNARGLWAVDVGTRREELLLDMTAGARVGGDERGLGEVDIAPSMTQLAFTVLTAPHGRRALYVSPVTSFQPTRVSPADVATGYPAWSPDERRIAVEIFDGDSTHAGVIDVATGSLRRLTSDAGHTWVRSWSPDGGRIAAAFQRGGLWHLGSIDASNGRQARLTESEPPRVYLRYPHWSPTGDRIVYERGETRGNIWTIGVP
jgi:Tol biopolymer transport system component/DNA-binding winged helix-turn-helix (wHTH) protein